jgi:hypothetical protein
MPRAGLSLIGAGILILILSQLSAVRAIGRFPFPRWLLFETVSCVASTALILWGWSRLQRAKAAFPDLSWPQFLRHDLIGIGIFGALMAVLLAIPREWREGLTQWLGEVMHLQHLLHLSK